MPLQRPGATLTAYDRAMRGLELIAQQDPDFWADDGGPDVIDLTRIAVGDHHWDVVAQWFRSRAGRGGAPADPYLAGLAALGIPLGEAGGYGFAGPAEGAVALVQGIHIHSLRTDTESRPPFSPRSERKPCHGMD